MNQPLTFVYVRVKQVLRELKSLGPVYTLFLLFSFAVTLLLFYKTQDGGRNSIITCVVLIAILLIIHFARNDHRLLLKHVNNRIAVYFTEYSFLIAPFIAISILGMQSAIPLLIFIPVFAICLIPVSQRGVFRSRFPVQLFGTMNFEWKSGMRKSGWMLLLLFVLSLALTPVPFVSLVVLWFMLLIISSFYEVHETREMLEAYELPSHKLLITKIFSHALLFTISSVIILAVSLWFFPERWWIYLLFLVYSIINIAVFIVSKYAVWGPGETHRSVTVTNVFCMSGFFLPFLLPLPVIVLLRNYKKSLNRLKPLLDDYA